MKSDPSKYIPNSTSSAEEWISWHKQLKKWFSKTEANAYFVKFWNQRAGAGTQADTHSLREYMSSQGVELTTDWTGELSDVTHDVTDWFVSGLEWTRAIIIGTTIIVIGIASYYLIAQIKKGKTLNDAAELAMKVRTGGMIGGTPSPKLLGQ
ncbi:hypothetical protein [Parvicella tangerina]|uniref:Uncharacterized protein n=1 Tax=Parvicella tangerina TaxID=2829795 RepID=A0A916JNK5_9FLAO|nr:hypothetical protein [Parvicella tangerina]CAG5082269.1 hypothetical protein CRYO30217_01860 [Parvicella tangerina]